VNGKKSFLPEFMYLERDDKEKHKTIFGDGYWIVNRPDLTDPWYPAPTAPLAQPIEWTLGKLISTAQYNNIDPPADGDLGVIKTKIDQEFGRLLPKLILASSDAEFDKLTSAFLKFKKDTGEAQLLAYQQLQVDKNKQRLGIK
jgi:putative aldouronate transport system substrate-binding protein